MSSLLIISAPIRAHVKQSAAQAMVRGQIIDIRDAPDDIPFEVIAQAKAAFNQRAQEPVAALVWDSLIDEGAPSWHHHLRFEHPRMWIQVSVSVEPGGANLHGVMHPAAPGRVELESTDWEMPVAAEVTRSAFRIERIERGLVRLALAGSDGAPTVYTDWFHV
jgi:hypothetical protein